MALIVDLIISSCEQDAFPRGKIIEKKKKNTFPLSAVFVRSSCSVLTAAINKPHLSPGDCLDSGESPNGYSSNLCLCLSPLHS